MGDSLSLWVPATHVGEKDGVFGSWLQSDTGQLLEPFGREPVDAENLFICSSLSAASCLPGLLGCAVLCASQGVQDRAVLSQDLSDPGFLGRGAGD